MFYYIRRDGDQVPLNDDIIIPKTSVAVAGPSSSLSNCSSGNSSPTTHSLSNGHSSSVAPTPTSSLTRNNSYDVSLPHMTTSISNYSSSSNNSNSSSTSTITTASLIGITKRRPSNNSLCRQQSSMINSNDNLFHENSAFAGIGDDDL